MKDYSYFTSDFQLGKSGNKWLTYGSEKGQDQHILTIAPTGAGKTTSSIFPTMLTYSGSILVIDPKGEIYKTTAKKRKEFGQEIHLIDPFKITGDNCSSYNPLWNLCPDTDPDEAFSKAVEISNIIISTPASGGGENAFFYDAAKTFLSAAILHICSSPKYAGNKNLPAVFDFLHGQDKSIVLSEMIENDIPYVKAKASELKSLYEESSRTFFNIFNQLSEAIKLLSFSNNIRACLSFDDFKFSDLKTEKGATIYLVMPEDKIEPFFQLLQLLIVSALNEMYQTKHLKPPSPALFLLEEFAALKHLKPVEQALGIARGAGVRLWVVLQNLGQLKQYYKETMETFIANSGLIEIYQANDNETASYFSEFLGKTLKTREVKSKSSGGGSSAQGHYSESTNESFSYSENHTVEPLFYPHELMQGKGQGQIFNPKTQKIIMVSGNAPIITQKIPYYQIFKEQELNQ